ncbi:hypothetical protein [Marinobacter salarius]|uniref:hypothetical protein n=1 Tax=Marinobacter salarius TaxID=1420917 RepID=UPI003BA93882
MKGSVKESAVPAICIVATLLSGGAQAEDITELAEHLEACEPYIMQFEHPFTGGMMKREIVSVAGNECLYEEQMPGDMLLICRYGESLRKRAADAYRSGGGAVLGNVMNEAGCEMEPIEH